MKMTINPKSKYGIRHDRPAGVRSPGNLPGDHGQYSVRTNPSGAHTKGPERPRGFSGRTAGRMVRRYKAGKK